jgi:acetyl esterase/lipase
MDVASTLDPEIAAGLAASPVGKIDFGSYDLATVPQLRAAMANMPAVELPPPTVDIHDEVIDATEDGATPTVRVYTPGAGSGRPCVYWIHGGGYLFGSALTRDLRLERWATTFDCVVVSIDYRLAPENPYPAPLEDCHAGLCWTANHARDLGIDRARITVVGASAGGGLAAGLTLLARDRAEVAVAHQVLIYPMLDDRNVTPSSHIVGTPVWNRAANLLGWRAYLGREPGGDDVPVYAAPARATDLTNLPPTFIGVGNLDVFRDENIEFGLRLLEAGVSTELHVYPGAVHGFEVIVPSATVSQCCQRDLDDALARALKPVGEAIATS